MSGLGLNDPRRELTRKQCDVLAYLCDHIEEGPQSIRAIAGATGHRGISSVLWSLRFRGIVDFERRTGTLVVTAVRAP